MSPSSLAGHAIELIDKIVKTNSPADKTISDFYRQRRYLGSHDRRWISDKIYGIVRNFILLDEVRKSCAQGPNALNEFLLHEILIAARRPAEVQADYSQLFDSYRLAGNEIDLEKLSSCSQGRFAEIAASRDELILNSFPDFFCEFLPPSVQGECTMIMQALNQEARVCIRVDETKISRAEAITFFVHDGIEAKISSFSPFGVYLPKRMNLNNCELYRTGKIEIQEEASQLVGLVVDPRKDEIIVDACAGAGGKSLAFASLSRDTSRIISLDVDKDRLDNLKTRVLRSGYQNISPRLMVNEESQGIGDLLAAADKVVIDAPCSGSGTIRRNPEKKFKLTRDAIEKKASYQLTLLKNYSRLVKDGGLLFYVTCSIFEMENQSVVKSFIESNSDFVAIDISQILSASKFARLIEDGCLTIYPHRCEMDGFFIAVMRRVS